MTTTTIPTFRQTKQGKWVAFGPAAQITEGTVDVVKRDGTIKSVLVESTGKSFQVDGVECCYGYIAQRENRVRRIPRCERCRHCGGDGSVEQELGTCEACGSDFD